MMRLSETSLELGDNYPVADLSKVYLHRQEAQCSEVLIGPAELRLLENGHVRHVGLRLAVQVLVSQNFAFIAFPDSEAATGGHPVNPCMILRRFALFEIEVVT